MIWGVCLITGYKNPHSITRHLLQSKTNHDLVYLPNMLHTIGVMILYVVILPKREHHQALYIDITSKGNTRNVPKKHYLQDFSAECVSIHH